MGHATHTDRKREEPPAEWYGPKPSDGYGRWMWQTANRRIVDALWADREQQLADYVTQHGADHDNWPVRHPPITLLFPMESHTPACVGCTWRGDTRWSREEAADAAATHSRTAV